MALMKPIDPLPQTHTPKGTDLTTLVRQSHNHNALLLVELTNGLCMAYEKDENGIRYGEVRYTQDCLEAWPLCGKHSAAGTESGFLEEKAITEHIRSHSPFGELTQKRDAAYKKMLAPLAIEQKYIPDQDLIGGLPIAAIGTLTWPITGPLALYALYAMSKSRGTAPAAVLAIMVAGAPYFLLYGLKELVIPSYQVNAIKNKEILVTKADGNSAALGYGFDPDCFEEITLRFPDGLTIHKSWSSHSQPDASYSQEKYFLPVDGKRKQEFESVVNEQHELYEKQNNISRNFFRDVRKEDHLALLEHLTFVTKEELDTFKKGEQTQHGR
ncbi:hypothetical protein HY639_03755 [Candidatus Woesearchaeota archaeon]|nr:hypothetical protein [Candidatus Woesearchaeota archaeon]